MPNFIIGSGWRRSTKAPAAVPQASKGASGPSTSPNTSVPKAARMTEAKTAGVTSKWSPSSGPRPVLPGSLQAIITIDAPIRGSSTTSHQAGSVIPKAFGRSVQTAVIRRSSRNRKIVAISEPSRANGIAKAIAFIGDGRSSGEICALASAEAIATAYRAVHWAPGYQSVALSARSN